MWWNIYKMIYRAAFYKLIPSSTWLIDFNGMPDRLQLFYARLEVHCTFIFTFFVWEFLLRFFAHGSIEYEFFKTNQFDAYIEP